MGGLGLDGGPLSLCGPPEPPLRGVPMGAKLPPLGRERGKGPRATVRGAYSGASLLPIRPRARGTAPRQSHGAGTEGTLPGVSTAPRHPWFVTVTHI